MQYVQLNADATAVVTWFAAQPPTTDDKPGYAEIADDDARYAAFLVDNPGATRTPVKR